MHKRLPITYCATACTSTVHVMDRLLTASIAQNTYNMDFQNKEGTNKANTLRTFGECASGNRMMCLTGGMGGGGGAASGCWASGLLAWSADSVCLLGASRSGQ